MGKGRSGQTAGGGQRRAAAKPALSEQASGPESVEDHLLHPLLFKLAKHVRARGTLRPLSEGKGVSWSPEAARRIHEQIVAWLKTGHIEQLSQLLQTTPTAIAHPVLVHQILHLQRLRRHRHQEEQEGLAWIVTDPNHPEAGYPLPEGTCKAVDDALRRLLTAFVQGLLEEPWTLKPKKKRGRKAGDISENFLLLGWYERVLPQLKKHHVRPAQPEQLCQIIREVWEKSGIGEELDSDAPPASAKPEDLADVRIVSRKLPLPEDKVTAWAHEACELAGEGPIRDRLAYALVSYRWQLMTKEELTVNQVRGRIQAARQFDKATE